MREIKAASIAETVKKLFLEANYVIGDDVRAAVARGREIEESPEGRAVLDQLVENYDIAACEQMAICQDTGMAVVFADLGQDAHIVGGAFEEAINDGVRAAYGEGYLRKSVVRDPLFERVNTRDNTPAIIHARVVPGDRLELVVAPKGFGSENMSRIKMLVPADGVAGVKKFVVDTMREAGPNPCPPVVLGVGIGGTFELAALVAKRMLTRPLDETNPDPRYALLEAELLDEINDLGIGPAGIGGRVTALKVNIGCYPTHIAGLPVAVNMCCHAARHARAII